MSNKVMHVIPQVDMRNSYDGLAAIAKDNRINCSALKPAEFVLFINNAFTACKLYAANGVIVCYRHPKGHTLNYKALQLIPHFFDGQDIGYSSALRAVIGKAYPELVKKGKRNDRD